ncbi:MAG TPA: O-antigen ligase family protein [Pyrinomonadaceae bacterium]|nr:O-antigen ligase family protein [Pyrinomonadaceae bacterium]
MRASETQSEAVKWIERGIVGALFLFAAFAPHSIAITQIAWLLGMLLWIVRFAFYPPPKTFRTPIDYALLGFFILTGLSAMLSYEPLISAGKLRAASLFTIVYLVAENVRSLRTLRLLGITLVASSLVNVCFSGAREVLGRGVKVEGVQADSPLVRAMSTPRTTARAVPIENGDTIFEVDGKKISNAGELAAALAAGPGPTAKVRIFRLEWTPVLEVPRGRLLPGATVESQLGIAGWTRGRDWRATGFYDHFVTYAESLQLIASLALGILLACPRKRSRLGIGLLVAVAGLVFALALTVTRASWAALFISAIVMLVLSASRKTIAIVGVCCIPLVIASALFLQQRRNVGFLDQHDLSTTWRETVWREGVQLLVSKPRHLLVGVGMDSLKAHWREWGLFEGGRIPIGHMHSNLLQIALERGVPALLAWFWLLAAYGVTLWKVFRRSTPDDDAQNLQSAIRNLQFSWLDRGIVLGAFGGLVGFFVSGLVHYNWGDSEVVMIFYFIMGLSLVINRKVATQPLSTDYSDYADSKPNQ